MGRVPEAPAASPGEPAAPVPVRADLAGEPAQEVLAAVLAAVASEPAQAAGRAGDTAVAQAAVPAVAPVAVPAVARADLVDGEDRASVAAVPINVGRVVGVATSRSWSRPN